MDRRRLLVPIGLVLIVLMTCSVYLPALNGGVLWDDKAHITKPELQSLGGLYRIWFELGATQQYYPLLHSAFWLEHALWGDSVLGYHLVNVLWHVVAVGLVYLILHRLKIPGALLAAGIFALHPVMVESVAWITEQKNTLSAVFYLSAMLVYFEFDQSRQRCCYLMALGLFVLGLLTKTVTATLAAALLVIFWWQRGTLSWRRDVQPLVPLFVLGAVAGVLTAWVERKLIGAEGADFELTLLQRGLLAGRVVWFYLSNLVWPAHLTFIYPRWTVDPARAWQWIFPIAALVTTGALLAIRKRWRAPLAGWLYFCGTLFPVLGFLNVYPFIFSYVADHFQYLASLGMIVPAAAGIANGLTRLPPPARTPGGALCILLVSTLAALTLRQSRLYADNVTLYQTTIARNPNCWMAHNNLGMELIGRRNPKGAMEHFELALRINPNNAAAHNNLGAVLAETGQLPEAIDHYHVALRLLPDYPDALNGLGAALALMGRFPEALEHIEHALRLRPNFAEAHTNLGMVLTNTGKIPQAMEQFRQALELNPNEVNAYKNLGICLAATGDLEEAKVRFEQALRLRPDFADVHNNLGELLRQTGRLQEAIEHYQAALRLKPDYLQAYANLTLALASMNRSTEAIMTAQQALQVARSTGQEAEAERIEQWLTDYGARLPRRPDAASPSQSPPPAQ